MYYNGSRSRPGDIMSWIAFALLSAILATLAALSQKKTLIKEHAMEYSTVLAIIVATLTLPFLFTASLDTIPLSAYALIYANSWLAAIAFLLVAKGLRHAPISTISPLLVLTPAITAVIAFFFLGETLSHLQMGGLAFLVIGLYVLESRKRGGIFQPFKKIMREKYVKLVLLALLAYGITSTIDKKIVGSAMEGGFGLSATAYVPISHVFIALNFIILQSVFYEGWEDVKQGLKHSGGWILMIAFLTVGYRLAQQHALTFAGSKVSLVIAIKKMSALASTVIGGELFHERNLFQKAVACAMMIAGAVLIIT